MKISTRHPKKAQLDFQPPALIVAAGCGPASRGKNASGMSAVAVRWLDPMKGTSL